MATIQVWDYLIFIILMCGSMAIDYIQQKKADDFTLKSAVGWSIFWVSIAVVYGGYLWVAHSAEMASLYFSGYVLEKVLSVDNLFVFSAIFAWFNVPSNLRHRVLFWGVLGAIVFRMIFVVIGAEILERFGAYAEILFGILIGYAAVMMLKRDDNDEDEQVDYENHFANRIVHRFFPVMPVLAGNKFFVTASEGDQILAQEGKKLEWKDGAKKSLYYATPLFVCMAVIELSDVMFAVDSVPAVIAISKEPLIVYSAMIFAVLGLRTLYFVLEALKDMLHHLEKAIIALLFFIAIKMFAAALKHLTGFGFEISTNLSMIIVFSILGIGVIASLALKPKAEQGAEVIAEANSNSETNPNSEAKEAPETSSAATETQAESNVESAEPAQAETEDSTADSAKSAKADK